MKPSSALFFMALIMAFSLIPFSSTAHAADACSTVLETKCTECHNLERLCQKLGKKKGPSWKKTIDRMVKKGAKLSNDDKILLLDCLAEQKEGAKISCTK